MPTVLADARQTSLAEESVNLIISDPPWDALDKWRSVGTTTRLGGHHRPELRTGWFETLSTQEIIEILRHAHSYLKPNSHLYWFVHPEAAGEVLIAAKKLFDYAKLLVWDKVNMGMGYHYRARHEFVLFAEKGKRRLNSLSIPDVLEFKAVTKRQQLYPTQKPLELVEVFIKQSSVAGELVFDMFTGSGTTAVAAVRNNRSFVGWDLNEEAVCIANERERSARNGMSVV